MCAAVPAVVLANTHYNQYIALITKKFRRDLLIYTLLEHSALPYATLSSHGAFVLRSFTIWLALL